MAGEVDAVEKLPFEKEEIVSDVPEAEKPPIEKKTAITRMPIPATSKGTLVGMTFEDQYRLAKAYCASKLMPRALNTPEKVLVALQLCYELNLPPITSFGKICVINDTPALFGDLPLALVMRSGLLATIEEKFEHADGNPVSATCIVVRGPIKTERTFSVSNAKRAGLWEKGVWKSYPERMLQMRARSWALKDTFPDVLMGCQIAEYDLNSLGGEDEEGTKDFSKELNDTYGATP